MQMLGAAMVYFGGFDALLRQRGDDLIEDGAVIQGWANEMVIQS
jgi:hypothetical protein